MTISSSADQAAQLLETTGRYFVRGGVAVALERGPDDEPVLRPLKATTLASSIETVADVFRLERKGNAAPYPTPAICRQADARLIRDSDSFIQRLPVIRRLAPCPVLIERNGDLILISGYDRESGILASDAPLPQLSLERAVEALQGLVADFCFATASDRSRAMAAFITPALVFGGLLGGRAPMHVYEANESQTGKGYMVKLLAACYGQKPSTITDRKGGVGSLEESLSSCLVRGSAFISLDNMRGRVDSPAIESLLTEDTFSARVPYQDNMTVDTRGVLLAMTSNQAELTPDLANRSTVIRLLKHPQGHVFADYPEGDLLDHVRVNHALFLGAVFSIVRSWYEAGMPRMATSEHDFRQWERTLGWIVENLLAEAPLLHGHAEAKKRAANPDLSWLRTVALAVAAGGRLGDELRAQDILEMLLDYPDAEVPGPAGNADSSNEDREKALRGIGVRMRRCFRDNPVRLDRFVIERTEVPDERQRPMRVYRFIETAASVEEGQTCPPIHPPASPGSPPLSAIPAMPRGTPSTAGKPAVHTESDGDGGREGSSEPGDRDGAPAFGRMDPLAGAGPNGRPPLLSSDVPQSGLAYTITGVWEGDAPPTVRLDEHELRLDTPALGDLIDLYGDDPQRWIGRRVFVKREHREYCGRPTESLRFFRNESKPRRSDEHQHFDWDCT